MATKTQTQMSDNPMTDPNLNSTAAATYPPHDCCEWNRQTSRITPDYLVTECGICGRITGFMWRSV